MNERQGLPLTFYVLAAIAIALMVMLAYSPARAQAWLHWQAWHAMHRCHPTGKPPAEIPDRARDGGQR